MNWGTKIVIGMLSFMSFILVLMVLMLRSDTDTLVENDYYEKGLKYDETYRLKEQVLRDNAKPEVSITEKSMTVAFKAASRGTIKLVRTSDQRQDRFLNFQTEEGNKIEIPLARLPDGQWKLIVNWKSRDGKAYLNEQEVIIP